VDQPGSSVLFLGDLTDPWVAEIADALPGPVDRADLGNAWPESWPRGTQGIRVVIVHRTTLTIRDGEAIKALKSRPGPSTRLILCVGPQVRAADLERWAGSADVILPEATASQFIARHVIDERRTRTDRPLVAVVASLFEPRRMIVECCEAAGFSAKACDDWSDAPRSGLVVWDVPLLNPVWDVILRGETSRRSVVCLMGFADREIVSRAQGSGASAWMDLPFEPRDLAFVLDRVSSQMPHTLAMDLPHKTPPQPKILRVARHPVAVRRLDS